MVEVVQTPARAVDVPVCLDRVSRLEVVALTEEDRRKTEMYVQDRKRRDLAASAIDLPGYLRSLQMEISVGLDDRRQIARIAQLSQKTNQFTLTTRRYTEDEVARLIQADDWLVAHFSLRDIFGDSGIVGIALVHQIAPDVAELDTFLMSCRVIGRMAETAFLEAVLDALRRRGVTTLLADYLPTPKNGLVAGFLPEHHFRSRSDGRFARALDGADRQRDIPILVRLADETQALSA
jgi:FkbH-like protein